MENLTKVCKKCEIEKPISEYAKKASNTTGIQSICKDCDKERHRIYRENNPEKEKERIRLKALRYKESRFKKVNIESKIIEKLQPEITEISQSYLNNNQMENQLTVKRVLVTPSFAKSTLEQNIKNRKVDQRLVNRYANDMSNGRWIVGTGELIKISNNNVLIDGQHRMLAIIKSNVSIFFDFAYEQNYEIFKVIDSGKKRNSTDNFGLRGIQNSNSLPSMIIRFESLKSEIGLKSLGYFY